VHGCVRAKRAPLRTNVLAQLTNKSQVRIPMMVTGGSDLS
jgi:hypothetical protein